MAALAKASSSLPNHPMRDVKRSSAAWRCVTKIALIGWCFIFVIKKINETCVEEYLSAGPEIMTRKSSGQNSVTCLVECRRCYATGS
jgi:hypothetical protein